jgi:hypothetical protein
METATIIIIIQNTELVFIAVSVFDRLCAVSKFRLNFIFRAEDKFQDISVLHLVA